MQDLRSRVTSLFTGAIAAIETRPLRQPNAWQRFQLFEALGALEVGDLDAAATSLQRVTSTPEVGSLEAVWRTPRMTLEEIKERYGRLQYALE